MQRAVKIYFKKKLTVINDSEVLKITLVMLRATILRA
jgi:hypothetical protein